MAKVILFGPVIVKPETAQTSTACLFPLREPTSFRRNSKSGSLCQRRGAAGRIGGYHCWAQFHTKDNGWVPVDISEADKAPTKKDYFFGRLNENRINFSTGRDIELVPKQTGTPLNYFVYPYVEVDGKPYPKEKIKLSFFYKDHE